ncbi:hypothetical protein GCM10023149_00910 [Mucilaginibacter gynuensis]|uniref:DUF3298 domain-containing protein n=1 Tax=Mucilaginibacter gynuensis TaxID=1302236 RepID=A0ABP8FN77_9SPHI
MKLINYATIVSLLALGSCQWGNTPTQTDGILKDTLTYQYQTLKERAPDCGNKPDSACTVVTLNYPEFAGKKALNDSIKRNLLTMFMLSEKPDTSLKSMAAHFIKSYLDAKKDDPRTQMFYTLDSHAKLIAQDSALVALEVGGYTYQGGAHGGSYTGYINWDIKKDKSVTLSDILVAGYNDKLTKIAEGIFRKNEKLSDTASLANDYFFKDNKFALNNNFSLTPLGIKFLYNQYEIKPYAAGQTELLVPYGDIKSLLQPNSVVSQYVKNK